MLADVNVVVVGMFGLIIDLFNRVYEEFGAYTYIFGAFIIYTMWRFLLSPIFGGQMGSDKVKKNNKVSDSED